ncbi:unnamed protein product [Chrysodeixis includens]|uniref:Apyrase n=1 Tax=Chrysodeixis includens TaxID=689277 RepID=A0A9P0BN32_CHRIL|nr:unnamed protein product [Chrysodeixis includens]
MIGWFNYLLCVCLLAVSGHVVRENELYKLDIVHYNDFHDRFEETSVEYPICQTKDSSCLGGFARLYHEVKTLLKQKPGALLLNAGDTFQGTYWYTLFKWNVTQHFINMLPNDAHALGNHEFDDGVAGLIPYIKAMRAPVLAANLVASNDSGLQGLYRNHLVLVKRGRKIGIIGLITQKTELLSNAEGVTFLDPIPVVQKEASLLKEKDDVDIIVVLSHCGLDVDMQIAKEVGENIDVIVGGHTHSLLWNGEAPSQEEVAGPYPVVVPTDSKPEHKVLVVTASAFTKYLGNLTVYFDIYGEMMKFEGEPIFLNRSIPESPKMKAILEPFATKIHTLVNQVVGYLNDDMDMNECSSKECALGNLFADALLHAANKRNTQSKLPKISFLQRCMIRSSIAKGPITTGSIINMSPFTNKVITVTIPGRHIIDALQMSVMNPWRRRPYAGGYTPHFSGLRVKINTTRAEVLDIFVKVDNEYLPFDMDQEYEVTTLDFLTRGGNGFTMFKEFGRDITVIGKDADAIEDYVRKASPITPKLDKRLVLVS